MPDKAFARSGCSPQSPEVPRHEVLLSGCSSARAIVPSGVRVDVCLNVRSNVRAGIHPNVRSNIRLSVHPSVRADVRSSVCPNVRADIHPSVRADIRSSVRPRVRADIRPSARPSVRTDVRLNVCAGVRLALHAEGYLTHSLWILLARHIDSSHHEQHTEGGNVFRKRCPRILLRSLDEWNTLVDGFLEHGFRTLAQGIVPLDSLSQAAAKWVLHRFILDLFSTMGG